MKKLSIDECIYELALEYIEVAAKAKKNGFTNDKITNATQNLEAIKERVNNPENFAKDKIYKASLKYASLVRDEKDYVARIGLYLQALDLNGFNPFTVLYDTKTTFDTYYVETEILYNDDHREEMKFFGPSNCITLRDFQKELKKRYEVNGHRILYIDGPFIRKSTQYSSKKLGLYTHNEYNVKGGE